MTLIRMMHETIERTKLGLTQATLRNWKQKRFAMEPAATTLLTLINREPEAALHALRGPQAVLLVVA